MAARTTSRLRALLALAVLTAAATARADWVQVTPPTGVSAAANLRAVVVAGAETWVVGDDGLSPVVLRGFETPTLVPQSDHHATGALLVACGFADGSLHAFGKNAIKASWNGGTASWSPSQPLFPSVTPSSASCVPASPAPLVYVAGAFSLVDPYLAEWQVGQATVSDLSPFLGSTIAAADFRGVRDGVLGAQNALYGFPDYALPLAGVPAFAGKFRAIRFSSTSGLAVARDTATPKTVVLQIGAGNAVDAGGDPGFALVNDATLLDTGFAVVVGDAGAVSVSHDGGASWSSRSIPSGPNLLSVACRDEVHCYLSGAAASLYYWRNEAPTAQITAVVEGTSRDPVGGVLTAVGNETVCLTALGTDLEEQPLTWLWSEPSLTLKGGSGTPLDGSTAASPECFDVPQCGGAFEIGATASDGELTGSAVVSLQASAAAITPTPQLDFTGGFVNGGLLSGTDSTQATLTPSHPCASSFDYAWDCLDSRGALVDPGNVPSAAFSNPGDLCSDESVTCSVSVTPTLAGQPNATVGVSVNYAAAASRPTTVATSFTNVSAQGVVALGQTGSVALTPENRCAGSYSTAWSCTDGVNPGASALTRDFVHPTTTTCGGQSVDCSVTITPDIGDPTTTSFSVSYEPSPRPVAIDSAFGGALTSGDQRLAVGESGRVTLAPSQSGCTTSFAATWSCSDGVNPAADVFFRDFTNARASGCADETITCSVTMRSGLTGETGATSFSVVLAPNPGAVVAPASFSSEFAGGDRLAVGQSGRVTLEPSQGSCTTSYQTAWSCSDGVNPAAGTLFRDFTNARTSGCADEPIDCSVEVISALDGTSTTTSFTVNLAPNPGPVEVANAYSSEFGGDERLNPNESGRVTLTPSQGGCTTTFASTWSCSDGVNPGADVFFRDFTNSRASGCADETITCSVEVRSALTGETASTSFAVVLAPNPGAVAAPATFSAEFTGDRLAVGQSGRVTLAPSQGTCTTSYQTVWSCSDGVNPASGALFRDFTNVRTSGCADEQISCSVEVISDLDGTSTTTNFTVDLAPNPGPVAVASAFDGALTSTDQRLAVGESGRVTLAPSQGTCTTSYQTAWSCSDGINPASGALSRDFTNARTSGCADEPISCSVEVTSDLDGTSATTSFTVNLAPNPGPVTIASTFGGTLTSTNQRLAVGESGRVTLTPSQGSCTTSFAATWSCSDGVNPGSAVFFRDFTNARASGCADEPITCNITMRSALTGETGSTSFAVLLAPNPGAVVAPASYSAEFAGGDRLAAGQSGRVTLTPSQGTCTTSYQTAWNCSDGGNPAAGALFRDFTNAPRSGCADELISCSVQVISALDGTSTTTDFTVNLAPNPEPVAIASAFGGALSSTDQRLSAGESGRVTLTPSQGNCATSFAATWSCSDGVNPSAGALYRDFANARTSESGCADEQISCSVQVLSAFDGTSATTSFTIDLAPNPGPVAIASAFGGALTSTDQRLAAGESGRVTLTPSQGGCTTTFASAWTCSDGLNPSAGALHRDFTNAHTSESGCADETITCDVTVRSALTGETSSTSFAVVLAPNPGVVVAPATFSVEFAGDRLAVGQSGRVTLTPSQGTCTTSYQTVWLCGDGANPAAGALFREFTNARTSGCADEPVSCSVEVTSALDGASTTTNFTVSLAPNPGPTTVNIALDGFGAGNALGYGQSGTMTAAAISECPGDFDYLWRCDGQPDVPGRFLSFPHTQQLCSDKSVRCTVEATPLGTGRAGSDVVDLKLLAAPFPAALEVQLSGPATIDEGETLTAVVTATHCPGASFAYAWECSGPGASGQGATATFVPPEPLCEDAYASCQVSVTATSEQGVAQPAASLPAQIEVHYHPDLAPPSNLQVGPIVVTSHEITAEAQIDARCFTPEYSWRAELRSSGELLGEGTGPVFGAALPPLCGSDWVDLELREANTGLSATAEQAVEVRRGALALADPLEQGYESRPRLDCAAALEPIVLEPRATGCVRGFDWRQTAGPTLSLVSRADGALVVQPRDVGFGGLVGRQVRFEVEAYNDDDRSATGAFELTFQPKPFVKVRHVADRPVAAAGELADFTVQLQVGCEAPPEAVDVHLALEDLDYVAGSARLDGQALAEPERSGGELVFRAVPLSAGSAPTIAYSARRKAIGSAQASSVASVYLSVAPEMRVSEDVAADSGGDRGVVPYLACSCGQSGSPSVLWTAGLALVLLRRRRRAAC